MLEGITLYSTLYYEKSVFMGSYRGMNFRLMKAGEEDQPRLHAVAWKGPLNFDKTKEEKIMEDFAFSDEGICEAGEWLEKQQKILFENENIEVK